MSYYPENSARGMKLLEDAIATDDTVDRTQIIESWLKFIGTPDGYAEKDLCFYLWQWHDIPERPIDLGFLRELVHEADLWWVSSAQSGIERTAAEKAARPKRARKVKAAKEEQRKAAIVEIYLKHYVKSFGGGRNADKAADAIHENWKTVSVGTSQEDTKVPSKRTLANAIRKSPRYKNKK